jgi:hypothetical protein
MKHTEKYLFMIAHFSYRCNEHAPLLWITPEHTQTL